MINFCMSMTEKSLLRRALKAYTKDNMKREPSEEVFGKI